jgi:hypothetical protein
MRGPAVLWGISPTSQCQNAHSRKADFGHVFQLLRKQAFNQFSSKALQSHAENRGGRTTTVPVVLGDGMKTIATTTAFGAFEL